MPDAPYSPRRDFRQCCVALGLFIIVFAGIWSELP
jgi:hypothetical protein